MMRLISANIPNPCLQLRSFTYVMRLRDDLIMFVFLGDVTDRCLLEGCKIRSEQTSRNVPSIRADGTGWAWMAESDDSGSLFVIITLTLMQVC